MRFLPHGIHDNQGCVPERSCCMILPDLSCCDSLTTRASAHKAFLTLSVSSLMMSDAPATRNIRVSPDPKGQYELLRHAEHSLSPSNEDQSRCAVAFIVRAKSLKMTSATSCSPSQSSRENTSLKAGAV